MDELIEKMAKAAYETIHEPEEWPDCSTYIQADGYRIAARAALAARSQIAVADDGDEK